MTPGVEGGTGQGSGKSGPSFLERVQRHPVAAWTLYGAALVGAVLAIVAAAVSVEDWFDRTFDWRDQEYNKLTGLYAGFSSKKFDDVLGKPAFVRTEDGFTESIYQGREYWVQTVADREGTVQTFAVTACESEFNPTFHMLDGQYGRPDRSPVTLGVTTMAAPDLQPYRFRYRVSGATANSRILDIGAGGNPSNYKSYAWGVTDICPDWASTVRGYDWEHSRFSGVHYPRDLPEWVRTLRAETIVNTYAETAPQFDFKTLRDTFQIGADRLLTRTVSNG